MVAKGAAVPTTTGVHGGLVKVADSNAINYKRSAVMSILISRGRNPLEALSSQKNFALVIGSDLRQAIWTAFDKNGIGIRHQRPALVASGRCIRWNGPPPRNKPTGSAAPPISSRPKQTAILPTTQLARRRR